MSNNPQQDDINNPSSEQTPHKSLADKKVDADPDEETAKPEEESLVTQESQKGKKVDADPELESDKPTETE